MRSPFVLGVGRSPAVESSRKTTLPACMTAASTPMKRQSRADLPRRCSWRNPTTAARPMSRCASELPQRAVRAGTGPRVATGKRCSDGASNVPSREGAESGERIMKRVVRACVAEPARGRKQGPERSCKISALHMQSRHEPLCRVPGPAGRLWTLLAKSQTPTAVPSAP